MGSTSAAAVDEAATAAEKPTPCRQRNTVSGIEPPTSAGPRAPMNRTAAPNTMTTMRRPRSINGPTNRRVVAADTEKTAMRKPA